MKCISVCKSWYQARDVKDRDNRAVDRRARNVSTEMQKKAEEKDAKYNNGTPLAGHFAAAVASFGPVQGLAFGAFGEVSPAVKELVELAAKGQAQLRWRQLGARDTTEARAFFLRRAKKMLGIQGVCQYAWMKTRMMQALDARSVREARARRDAAKRKFREWDAEYYSFARSDYGWRQGRWWDK